MLQDEKEELKKLISIKESEGAESLKIIKSENEKLQNDKTKIETELQNQIKLSVSNESEKKLFIQNMKNVHNDEIEIFKKQINEFEIQLRVGESSLEFSKKEFEEGIKKKDEIVENLQKLILAAETEFKNFKIIEENLKIAALADFENKVKQINEEKTKEKQLALDEEKKKSNLKKEEEMKELIEKKDNEKEKAINEETIRCDLLKECSLIEHSVAAESAKEQALQEASVIALGILKSSEERSAAALVLEKSAGEASVAAAIVLRDKAMVDLQTADERQLLQHILFYFSLFYSNLLYFILFYSYVINFSTAR